MKNKIIELIESKIPGSKPLFIARRGSHAYGTNIETSDEDFSFIYIQPIEDIFGFKYKEQINDDKNDIVGYEIKRFLDLLKTNNPGIIELLNTPEDCILYKDPVFNLILDQKDKFITKLCSKSFGGYGISQISKALGKDKKQNWEKERVVRKTPIDFCYLHIKEKSIPITNYFMNNNLNQKFSGLSKIPHSKDVYALFYNFEQNRLENNKDNFFIKTFNRITKYKGNLKFKGIEFENSNDIKLSSIPFDCPEKFFIGHLSYNKDAYSQHCKDYNEYQEWINKRNNQRWIDVQEHNQKIDGKNMMHCRRLLEMAIEIGEGKGVNVKRPNTKELLDIRKGKLDLKTLVDKSNEDIKRMSDLFKNSNLPDFVDEEVINDLLIEIRKQTY